MVACLFGLACCAKSSSVQPRTARSGPAVDVTSVWAVQLRRFCGSATLKTLEAAIRNLQSSTVRALCCIALDQKALLLHIIDENGGDPANVEIVSFAKPATFRVRPPGRFAFDAKGRAKFTSQVSKIVFFTRPRDSEVNKTTLYIAFGRDFPLSKSEQRELFLTTASPVDFLGLRSSECSLAEPSLVPQVI